MSGFVEKPEPRQVPGLVHLHTGKVRDLYRNDAGDLVMVASDRMSAYDWVLPTEIPDKGRVLTQLSLWWFDQLADLVPNHVLSTELPAGAPADWAGRTLVCKSLRMVPVECVARGYLTGSGLAEYDESRTVCGLALPEGLVDGSELPAPIFTPATKADVGEHDENVSYEEVARRVGADTAARLRQVTLAVYSRARDIARERGSSWPTPSSSSVSRATATSTWSSPTRSSPRTPPASGRPTSGSRAGRSRRTTSSSCGTGSPRPSPAGTAGASSPRRRCRRRSSKRPAPSTSRRTSA